MNYRDVLCILLGLAPTASDLDLTAAARAFAIRNPVSGGVQKFQGMSAGREFQSPTETAEFVRQQLGISKEDWDRQD